MKTVAASGPTTKGIDISHHQSSVMFRDVKQAGYEFCYMKATEGLSMVDPLFKMRWLEAQGANLIVGAYHYFHPGSDPIKQAEHFCLEIGPMPSGTLPPVMDWETTDGVPNRLDLANGLSFLYKVASLTGRQPMIYTGPYFAQALQLTSIFREFPLWIAHYGVHSPLVPNPFDKWTIHQYADHGPVPGDQNVFNGTLDDLKKFCV